MPQDFNLHRWICSSTGWCNLWFSGGGNLNPTNSPIYMLWWPNRPQFVVYSDLWKWLNCHWHHSCESCCHLHLHSHLQVGLKMVWIVSQQRQACLPLLLWPEMISLLLMGQAGPQFQQNLFHRLLVSTSICAIHCLQNCSLKSLSHSFSSIIIWFGQCSQKKCVPELRTLQPGRSYSSNPFPSRLEWFIAIIPPSHPLHTPACYRLSMAGLR